MSWLIVIVVVIVLVAAAVWVYQQRRRRAELHETFGSEYPRAVEEAGSRRDAERELLGRKQRHEQLDIQPLQPERRERYSTEWIGVQARFVDEPSAALADANTLVDRVMAERGYPVGDFERRTEDLSVEHAAVLDHYRAAHVISGLSRTNQATTEQMREAMVHYRALFESLLSADREPHETR